MTPLTASLASESCTSLLLALGHTLWQGALAGGALFLYLRRTPAEAANRRYLVSLAALGAVLLGGLLTWSILSYEPSSTHRGLGQDVAAADSVPVSTPEVPEPAGMRERSATAGIKEPSAASGRWQVQIMEAWLVGVALMLGRLAAALIGGGRLRRVCRPMEDSRTLDLIQQLRDRMGIGRKVRVLVGERLTMPGVIGCFWPALLLPASMTSGIAAADLQAILVHELAHIWRYDYLVNFGQMVVEALLFFNPAVWWISRQIRVEREACCDAAGVQWTGQRTRYAEVLVAWAQRFGASAGGTPAPAVGFGRNADGGNILDRVRRILVAGHQPRPHVPWHIAIVTLVLSLAGLVLLQQATGLAVNRAGRILTPQERIDTIAGISKEYGHENRQHGPEDKIEVSGVVRTWDGAPLPARVNLLLRCVGGRFGANIGVVVSQNGTFRAPLNYGRVYATASAEGYAAAFAGPFEARAGGPVEGIELVLGQGFPGRIRVVDEKGQPVPGATLVGGYTYPDSGSYQYAIKLTTDANGLAILQHAASEKITLRVEADGFESEPTEGLVLDPQQARVVALRRTEPARGTVVSKATGQPLAGAEIRIVMAARGNASYAMNYVTGVPDAVTDAQGGFALDRLRHDRKYLLFVRAPGYGYRYVPDIEAGHRDIKVVLGEKKSIRGTITGDLSLLATDPRSGRPVIHVENRYQYPESSSYSNASAWGFVTVRDGVGSFEIDNFWGQTVTLLAGPQQVRLDPDQDRLDQVVIDLRRSAQRQVILRFATPAGGPPIEGAVRIDCIAEQWRRQGQGMTPQRLDIQAGQARCEIPVPSQLSYGIDFRQGRRPVGYWFNEARGIGIAPGNEPFVIDVPVFPAGAIYGKILRPDGSSADQARATLMIVKKPGIEGQQAVALSELHDALSDGVERGTFNATPLPWGGTYAVVAYEDYAFAMSDAFTLDEKNPIVNVDLQLPHGVDVAGRLLAADGTPARNDVALDISLKRGEQSWGMGCGNIQPDETGRFVFRNVSVGPAGECSVRVVGGAGYRPATHKLKDLRAPVVIQLEKGCRVTGTVIDDGTGWPVPGVEVYAFAVDGPDGRISRSWEMLEAEGRTDEQGRFTFTNMAASQYSLNVRAVNRTDQQQPVVVTGGQNDPVVLRLRIPEWSDLKPRPPQ